MLLHMQQAALSGAAGAASCRGSLKGLQNRFDHASDAVRVVVRGDPVGRVEHRLYAVSHALAEDLDIEKEALHPVTQPEIFPVLLDRITVYGKDGKEQAEWRLRGEITDPDATTNWEITAPFRYCADETTIGNLKTSAGNLRMGVYMGEAHVTF